ncbi:MAG: MFS transporter [Candidatus Eremiobacteraeota bacterium]|nr:MFS transporter [Candidatus Eremiobacteraeota bacterium]
MTARSALQFVVVMGVVNLFADMTYEGGRGEVGAFLGHLGASGAIVGLVAGGGELAGYAIRSLAGTVADRTGKYWLDAWIGYAINMLCVPALALAGSWPAAAGLVVGERLGRGIRRPVISAMLAEAGREMGGRGFAFGLNEALDQTGATIGPLIVAYVIARTGAFSTAFAVLIVPALLTLVSLLPASKLGARLVPRPDAFRADAFREPAIRDRAAFWRYAIGGALVAAGYVDFSLIAFRFQRDHVVSIAAISVWFAVAMVVAAIASPVLGRLYDRFGNAVVAATIAVGALAAPLAFLGSGAIAESGASLWGLGTAVQDALLLALVASVITKGRGATTFGLYDLIFGVAWFAGSAVLGALLDRSTVALTVVSVVLQLAAIPVFVTGAKPAAGSLPSQ